MQIRDSRDPLFFDSVPGARLEQDSSSPVLLKLSLAPPGKFAGIRSTMEKLLEKTDARVAVL